MSDGPCYQPGEADGYAEPDSERQHIESLSRALDIIIGAVGVRHGREHLGWFSQCGDPVCRASAEYERQAAG